MEKPSSPHTSDVPSSWLEYFPGEEFRLDDRRAMLIKSLLDFFQTSAAKQILSQVRWNHRASKSFPCDESSLETISWNMILYNDNLHLNSISSYAAFI